MPGDSSRTLTEKLGVGPDTTVVLLGGPPGYAALLGALPPGARIVTRLPSTARFIHQFARLRIELEAALPRAAGVLADDGMLWVSWPKRASRIPTDVTEDVVRAVALPLGLVDVKVCAVDEVWSGLKLVRRKELRGRGPVSP
ncbi:MAG TPA: DUF3052 domain-containing protein [Gemmatimonadales bacterium]|nr:DUF3052 domain-containing protein [Gemmatimonadales bacterium]